MDPDHFAAKERLSDILVYHGHELLCEALNMKSMSPSYTAILFTKAKACFDEALKLFAEEVRIMVFKTICHVELGERSEALATINRVAHPQRCFDCEVYIIKAKILWSLGSFDEGNAEIKRATGLNTEHVEVLNFTARTYSKVDKLYKIAIGKIDRGELESAREDIALAISIAREDVKCHILMSKINRILGDLENAFLAIQRAASIYRYANRGPKRVTINGHGHQSLSNRVSRKSHADNKRISMRSSLRSQPFSPFSMKVQPLQPVSPLTLQLPGESPFGVKEKGSPNDDISFADSDASSIFTLSPRDDFSPGNSVISMQAMMRKGMKNDFPDGVPDDNYYNMDEQDNEDEWYLPLELIKQRNLLFNEMALHYAEKGQYEEAVLLLGRAIDSELNVLDSGRFLEFKCNYRYLLNRGDCHRMLKNFTQSLADYMAAWRDRPADWEIQTRIALAYYARGVVAFNHGSYHSADQDLTEAIKYNSKVFEFYSCRGKARYYTGNYSTAFGDFIEALKIKPEDVETRALVEQFFQAKNTTSGMIVDMSDIPTEIQSKARGVSIMEMDEKLSADRGVLYMKTSKSDMVDSLLSPHRLKRGSHSINHKSFLAEPSHSKQLRSGGNNLENYATSHIPAKIHLARMNPKFVEPLIAAEVAHAIDAQVKTMYGSHEVPKKNTSALWKVMKTASSLAEAKSKTIDPIEMMQKKRNKAIGRMASDTNANTLIKGIYMGNIDYRTLSTDSFGATTEEHADSGNEKGKANGRGNHTGRGAKRTRKGGPRAPAIRLKLEPLQPLPQKEREETEEAEDEEERMPQPNARIVIKGAEVVDQQRMKENVRAQETKIQTIKTVNTVETTELKSTVIREVMSRSRRPSLTLTGGLSSMA
jgi:tetratricopeptide (TPR) repeat protein